MLLTEEQARTKWCPKARQTDGDHRTCNRMEDGSAPGSCLCITSDCIAWQWGQKPRQVVRNYHDDHDAIPVSFASGVRTYPDGWQYEITDQDHDGRKFDYLSRPAPDDAPEVGYCGAFGRPEV